MSDSEHELSITRFIDAPPETVYRVYTERTAEWWAPKPWKTRIVATNAFAAGWEPRTKMDSDCDFPSVTIVTFEPEGSGTRYTARVRHWSEAAVQAHEAMGFEQGWSMVAAQLAQLAEEEAREPVAA